LLPGWGRVPCFAIAGPASFRPPPPPAVGTPEYTAAYREVAALGRADSPVRTRDQTEVAFFWADGDGTVTPPGHWNRIAQAVAADRRLTLPEAARLFAALNAALADAAVVCWECKYHFDVWRPVTAARETDPTWAPLLPTPPFPAYTSGHSSFSGAAAAALATFFGTDEVAFATTSDGLPGVTRAFRRFSAAAEEAGMSRVYGGIHWQFDNTAGLQCGRAVGAEAARRFGLPARAPDGVTLPPPVVEVLRGGG
jgi:membrane-associated phospholipid phosphatase